MMTTAFKQLE